MTCPLTDEIEINDDFIKCCELISLRNGHVFITGKAGTGKSTFLNYFRKKVNKHFVVLAPTGVAAINVGGQTIHSFFNFKPDITPKTVASVKLRPDSAHLYKKLQLIIVDEISMVRADLLDCIDIFLRIYGPDSQLPFGGVQMVFIGDLFQLPPVVLPGEKRIFSSLYKSPYFFSGRVFQNAQMEIIEFARNYRQDNIHFMGLLDAVRINKLEQKHLTLLNSRYDPLYEPPKDVSVIYLTTTNQLADQINKDRLITLSEDLFSNEGVLKGGFNEKSCPAHRVLDIKIGAQVMLLNNDPEGRWVNGSLGVVTDIFNAGFNAMAIQVKLTNGQTVEVEPFTWELHEYFYNKSNDTIDVRSVGSFKQFPMRLAWAITIHKSQGKTFDRVIIDVGNGAFCHGQVYVALSRCRTLEGIVLKRKVSAQDIYIDNEVIDFFHSYTKLNNSG